MPGAPAARLAPAPWGLYGAPPPLSLILVLVLVLVLVLSFWTWWPHFVSLLLCLHRAGYNAKQTLSKLAMKAGLEPNAWRRGCKYTVFLTSKLTKDFC